MSYWLRLMRNWSRNLVTTTNAGNESLPSALLSGVKVVSFDLDDTLWPLERVLLDAEQKQYDWIVENAANVANDLSRQQVSQKRSEFLKLNPQWFGDVTAMRKHSLAALFAEYDYSADAVNNMVEDVFAVFYQARSQVVLFDDALQCLEDLRKTFKVAAITNGNADLEIAGIAHLFDDVRCATLQSPPKPDTHMFFACAKEFGVVPAEILHVGDNIQTDVGGGQAAGTLTAWYNPGGLAWPADQPVATVELKNLAELPRLLANSRQS